MNNTELLTPAGNLNNLRYALAYGADAVYAGMPRYSLRVRNNDFHKLDNLAQASGKPMPPAKAFIWPAMRCRIMPRSRLSSGTWSPSWNWGRTPSSWRTPD